MATTLLVASFSCTNVSQSTEAGKHRGPRKELCPQPISLKSHLALSSFSTLCCSSEFRHLPYTSPSFLHVHHHLQNHASGHIVACISSSSLSQPGSSIATKLYISGLSFRTTKESLQKAFEPFGQLEEVNLVMDRIANRPRGFAFISYATEEESKKAIEGMHGKFLDGRVIFVEVAKPRPDGRRNSPVPRGSLR